MKKGIIVGSIILLVFIIFLGVYFFLNNSNKNNCDLLKSIDNSEKTKGVVECYLNNEKSSFKSSIENVSASEILKGECKVTEIKDKYLDNNNNQVVNKPCTNCHLDGGVVWFECSEYTPQGPFGCFFNIDNDFSFDEIRCPLRV
jgi:hypothetical protein